MGQNVATLKKLHKIYRFWLNNCLNPSLKVAKTGTTGMSKKCHALNPFDTDIADIAPGSMI